MKRLTLAAICTAVVVFVLPASAAFAGQLTLHPNGFGSMTYSSWKANFGEADDSGDSQGLYFQKHTTDPIAAVAFVRGLEGEPVSSLTGLAWEHNVADEDDCRAGSPRWNIDITGSDGEPYRFFLGCAAAFHSNGQEFPEWIRDSYDSTTIGLFGCANSNLSPEQCAAAQGGTIRSLGIFVDGDGNPTDITLDNITVNDVTWTYAGDNGN